MFLGFIERSAPRRSAPLLHWCEVEVRIVEELNRCECFKKRCFKSQEVLVVLVGRKVKRKNFSMFSGYSTIEDLGENWEVYIK